jgi:16S rRNA (adenine1518-N6/adenine1519-N6)-dimethyltransferase
MTSPRTLLATRRMRPKKKLGQNFLTDPNVPRSMVGLMRLSGSETVVEIGAGLGALTLPLARRVRRVLAIERDPDIARLLSMEIDGQRLTNVALLVADILTVDLSRLARQSGRPVAIAGNLPYHLSSQIVLHLIAHRRMLTSAVLMLQKEVVDRLVAVPGKKTYGRLTAMLRYCADVRRLMPVPSTCFFPRPKVDSAVLRIDFVERYPGSTPAAETFLSRVVKAAFGRRRKTLANALAGSELALDAAMSKQLLEKAGIDSRRRAETLSVEEFVSLSRHLAGHLGQTPIPSP